MLAGALLVTLATVQLSAVTGVPRFTPVATQELLTKAVTSPGQVMVGGCLSSTVTVNVQELLLPELSVAVLVTVVVPTGNEEPLAGLLTTVTEPAQLSDVGMAKVTLLAQEPAAALAVMFPGQVIEGGCLSSTVTVK